jgi:hypothetical protein
MIKSNDNIFDLVNVNITNYEFIFNLFEILFFQKIVWVFLDKIYITFGWKKQRKGKLTYFWIYSITKFERGKFYKYIFIYIYTLMFPPRYLEIIGVT